MQASASLARCARAGAGRARHMLCAIDLEMLNCIRLGRLVDSTSPQAPAGGQNATCVRLETNLGNKRSHPPDSVSGGNPLYKPVAEPVMTWTPVNLARVRQVNLVMPVMPSQPTHPRRKLGYIKVGISQRSGQEGAHHHTRGRAAIQGIRLPGALPGPDRQSATGTGWSEEGLGEAGLSFLCRIGWASLCRSLQGS